MKFLRLLAFFLLAPVTLAQVNFPEIKLEPVLSDLQLPVYATMPNDDTGRIFIVSLDGFVYIVKDGKQYNLPFLSLDGIVTALSAEQGMYSIAFHPDYKNNRRFFVSYIEKDSEDFIVAEYLAYKNIPDFADPKSAKEILRFSPKAPYHQGGQLNFGPDGYLYIAIGDGGEPLVQKVADFNAAQRLDSFAGKLLRINIDEQDGGKNYGIPADNPFTKLSWVKTEIYAFGFRNPWKFSFDRETHELYLSDVGNYDWEEVNLVRAGANYGWPHKEGPVCFFFPLPTDQPKEERYADPNCETSRRYASPLYHYGHVAFDKKGGNAITGGYVYRGEAFPTMQGFYFFADWTNGRMWALSHSAYGSLAQEVLDTDYQISSFFEDNKGELFILTIDGGMYQLVSEE
ncbi:MAG: PQQ-dependent sugar dehydrogenase [Trueperaceae bacterium]